MKRLALGPRALAWGLAIGAACAPLGGCIVPVGDGSALKTRAFAHLEAVRDIRKRQVERYFAERRRDLALLAATVATLREEAVARLAAVREARAAQIERHFEQTLLYVSAFARSKDVAELLARLRDYGEIAKTKPDGPYNVDTPEYKRLYARFGAPVSQFYKESGFLDLFVIDGEHGHVMFTAARGKDLGTNLAHGPYKGGPLAKLWARVKAANRGALVDFEPYVPCNNDPSAFVGYPIRDPEGKAIGVMAVQLSTFHINRIMQQRGGLGVTGEAYLVGPDKRMRSDCFGDKTRTLKASFADRDKGRVETEAADRALDGDTGVAILRGPRGAPVLSAYCPVDVGDMSWALIAEVDIAEALCPKPKGAEKDLLAQYAELYGYGDLFLVNPDGYCFHTVGHRDDWKSNLLEGKYARSALGRLTQKVLTTGQYALADFEPYGPSDGEPSAFLAQPVLREGKAELVVALQLLPDGLSALLGERSGLGKTGEAYLVGPDHLLRSDSIGDPKDRSVRASFADPESGRVATTAAREALAGRAGIKVITGYHGRRVLSAYCAVKVDGLTWALVAEMDAREAFAP